MSVNYELLGKLYPEWESQTPPLLIMVKIFLVIVFFLIIPYIYIKYVEGRLEILWRKIRPGASDSIPPPNSV